MGGSHIWLPLQHGADGHRGGTEGAEGEQREQRETTREHRGAGSEHEQRASGRLKWALAREQSGDTLVSSPSRVAIVLGILYKVPYI